MGPSPIPPTSENDLDQWHEPSVMHESHSPPAFTEEEPERQLIDPVVSDMGLYSIPISENDIFLDECHVLWYEPSILPPVFTEEELERQHDDPVVSDMDLSPAPPTNGNDINLNQCLAFCHEPSFMHKSHLPPVFNEKEPEREHEDPIVSDMDPSQTLPSENDINLDQWHEPSVMHESHLPPVFTEEKPERQHVYPVVSDSTTTRKQNMRKDDMFNIPISLFDQPSAAILKMRKHVKLRREVKYLMVGTNSVSKPGHTFTSLKPSPFVVNSLAPDITQNESEWLISEDYSILQVIQDQQDIPIDLTVVMPGHTPNWDLAAEVVNAVSRVYRSDRNCKNRFKNVLMFREDKNVYGNNPKKTKKSYELCKTNNNHPMQTSHLYQQDNNAAYTNVFLERCKTVMELAKCKAQAKTVKIETLTGEIPDPLSILNDCGINYDEPLSPMEIASNRLKRRKEIRLAKAQSIRATVADVQEPTQTVLQEAEDLSEERQVQQLSVRTMTEAASLIQAVIASLDQAQQLQLNKCRDTRSAFEDCIPDTLDDYKIKIPNSVQLVQSELPLSEAENGVKLIGLYLFRQIISPNDNKLKCLFCRNKYSFTSPEELERHYHVFHELAVSTWQAEFFKDVVYICLPSDIDEETTVNYPCQFCDTTLKYLHTIRDHYTNAHNLTARLLSESDVMESGNFFYCSLCSDASADFPSHCQHLKVIHKLQTYVCPYCTYCISRLSPLKTHIKQRHLQDQPGSHLQCSVYVHGKDGLSKYMLSHALQTGTEDPNQLDRNISVEIFSQTEEQTGVWELQQYLKVILLNGNVSDVALKVKGQEFRAHKCVLAARSSVFSAMTTHETKEQNTDILDIKDVDPGVFLDFLSYLYTGNIRYVTSQNAVELYIVANKYQVYELQNICVHYMLKSISIENFCEILALSLRHVEIDLTGACTKFFIKNSSAIVLTLKWQIFLSENPVESIEYIKQLQRIK